MSKGDRGIGDRVIGDRQSSDRESEDRGIGDRGIGDLTIEQLGLMDDDERAVVEALRDDYTVACSEAQIPSAGLVWWRANLRARAEAAEKAERPLSVGHGVIGAAVAGAACAAAGIVWRAFPQPSIAVIITVAVAVCVVVAPLALVLTLARD
jgi:hypothetical protein